MVLSVCSICGITEFMQDLADFSELSYSMLVLYIRDCGGLSKDVILGPLYFIQVFYMSVGYSLGLTAVMKCSFLLFYLLSM